MTVFRDEADPQGTWFSYFASRFDERTKKVVFDEPLPNAARFRIRSAVPFYVERRKTRKQRHEFVLNTETKAMERVSFPDDQTAEEAERERDDLREYVVTGIENATWADGSVIDCTRDNKLRLFKVAEFDRFVGRCLTMIADFSASAEKN